MRTSIRSVVLLAMALCVAVNRGGQSPDDLRPELSGIYPHLAFFNQESECGTGAVVPWADRLWVVTYAPHAPTGSTDKLYEITPDLHQIVRPESIGGTPANRMIHRESRQLFIGPYAIDAHRNVRVIPYDRMFGRPTGNARHLLDPARKIYCATMEEGLYEIDVETLAVTELWADEQKKEGRHAELPGYHGKGLYSGQGRLVYSNNGEHGEEARRRPDVSSGALVEWDGRSPSWTVVRRNQFTEVTGPGGLLGNSHPDTDPVWSIGWDHRSLILMVLDDGRWHAFRLPKASHSYDGAHGWNTEWPRTRDIGEQDWLMTMHGMFWRFPPSLSASRSSGIAPRSTYLKVVGDFCRWNDRIVFGCDDTARNEFLNKRRAKGRIAPPQSQSNLWFVEPARLDQLGPAIGRGAVWLEDDVPGGRASEPFLFSGFDRRALHLTHEGDRAVTIRLEADEFGNGQWRDLREVRLSARDYVWIDLSDGIDAAWIRLSSPQPLHRVTAWFHYANDDTRPSTRSSIFAGLASAGEQRMIGGTVRARSQDRRDLHFAATQSGPGSATTVGLYELGADLALRRVEDAAALTFHQENTTIPTGVLSVDKASVLFIDDDGHRWRLPKGDAAFDEEHVLGPYRVDREVTTERDLFNAHGTFYELPAENAGGFAKLRPIATHNSRIFDYCSYRGLLIISGIAADAPDHNRHILRSEDGKAALWAGAVDDVWSLGKPRGSGGPWRETPVDANERSDPYLMTGYDRKTLHLSHSGEGTVSTHVEVDLTGTGLWRTYKVLAVPPNQTVQHVFPAAFQAYWIRFFTEQPTTATALLFYE